LAHANVSLGMRTPAGSVTPAGSMTPAGSSMSMPGTRKFCTQCGAVQEMSARFCGECGARRSNLPEREDSARSEPMSRENSYMSRENSLRENSLRENSLRENSLRSDTELGLARKGIYLGRGAWAEAYRSASDGPRREALTMLMMTGIITQRELASDLTEVHQEHIEECICIASEMLMQWPAKFGLPPQHEAKLYFEQRLAQLHASKMPSLSISPASNVPPTSIPQRTPYHNCGLYDSPAERLRQPGSAISSVAMVQVPAVSTWS